MPYGSIIIILLRPKMFQSSPEKPPRSRRYVEEAFKHIQSKKNIRDIIIINEHGHPVKSSMDHERSVRFAGYFQELRGRLERGMKQIDDTDELLMLRVRTNSHEVLLTPDSKITLIVVQNAEN